jgi:hypothetical protein
MQVSFVGQRVRTLPRILTPPLSNPSVPKYRDFFVYDITNAAEYAAGTTDVPEVHEIGPFVSRCYSESFDVEFKGSTISYRDHMYCQWEKDNARNVDDFDEYMVNDGDVKLITHMNAGYNKVLGLSMNEGAIFLQASGCSVAQIVNIANLAPDDPADTVLPCSWATMKPMNPTPGSDENDKCGCCIPGQGTLTSTQMRDATWASTAFTPYQPLYGASTAIMPCEMLSQPKDLGAGGEINDQYPANQVAKKLHTLATYDGGIESPTTLTTTAANIPITVRTPQIVKKTVNEIAFGYPTAVLGYFLQQMVLSDTALATIKGAFAGFPLPPGAPTITLTDAQAKAYNLNNIAALPGQTLGRTTTDVGKVCKDKCSLGAMFNPADPTTWATALSMSSCAGYAADAEDIADENLKYLGGINCMPYTATFVYNVAVMIERYAADGAAAAGGTAPVYANEIPTCASDLTVNLATFQPDTVTKFDYEFAKVRAFILGGGSGANLDAELCCIAEGNHAVLGDLQGMGCLAHFSGYLNSRNTYSVEEKKTIDDLGKKIKIPTLGVDMYIAAEPVQTYKQNTGCDSDSAIGTDVQELLEYKGKVSRGVLGSGKKGA